MMESKTCVFCNKEINGPGNSARPLEEGFCCDDCNDKIVIPARLANLLYHQSNV